MSALLPLRYAWRSLRRSPLFTVASALTLALGIGATAAIFSVVNAVLLRPLPFSDSGRLVTAWHVAPGMGIARVEQSLGTYFVYRRASRQFESLGAYQLEAFNLADPRSGAQPERVRAALITASLLPTLGVAPLRGRNISEAEDRPGAPQVVLIGEGLWRRRFGADPSILGRTIDVNGVPREVVGIMPASFRFPEPETQLWTALALDPAAVEAGGFDFPLVARLRRGVTVRAAEVDLTRSLQRLPEMYPTLGLGIKTADILSQSKLRPIVRPMRDDVVGDFAQVLWIVAGTAGLVLLVACANVANLLLVRAEGRQRELAVRTALGASRLRVLGHFLAEGIVLAIIGGAVGLALAFVGVRALVASGPSQIPRLSEIGVDGSALGFTILISVVVALLSSVLPALRYRAVNLGGALREGGRSGMAGRERHRARSALVAAQVTLAVVLLAGSGLLARSVRRLQAVRPGFAPEQVLTLWLALPNAKYPQGADISRFYSQLVDRIGELPGVRAAGVVSKLPLQQEGMNLNPVWIEGVPQPPNEIPPTSVLVRASGTYFRAMGIPLIAGRTFDRSDGQQSPYEFVVSRSFAELHWKDPTGQRALGRRARALPDGKWYTIIGVVESVRDTSLRAQSSTMVYIPTVAADSIYPGLSPTMSLVVRTAGDPAAASDAVQREIRALDPTLPVFNARPMAEVVGRSMARVSFTMLVLGVASGVALLLGTVGLYGVIAYVVSMRTREIGVRIALGALPAQVSRMVARQGIVLALTGVGAGLAVFLALARFLRALLFEVSPTDPLTLGAVSVLLVLVAAAASWLPAYRASRIDPTEALRAE